MQRFDLGQLEILQALLETQSVSQAADLMGVTPSAMSRSLGKIRASLNDEILIPSGRNLVLTKRGQVLRNEVKRKIDEIHAILMPREAFDPAKMKRQFHVRTNSSSEGLIVEALVPIIAKEAPLSCLVIHPEGDENPEPLRDGRIDLDVGARALTDSDFMTQSLFNDRHVSVFCKTKFQSSKQSLDEFCNTPHLIVSRKGKCSTVVDEELKRIGRHRQIMATLATYHEAFEIASRVKCIVTAPMRFFERCGGRYKLAMCPLPVKTPPLEISQTWHPRHQEDPEHQWLRQQMRMAFKKG